MLNCLFGGSWDLAYMSQISNNKKFCLELNRHLKLFCSEVEIVVLMSSQLHHIAADFVFSGKSWTFSDYNCLRFHVTLPAWQRSAYHSDICAGVYTPVLCYFCTRKFLNADAAPRSRKDLKIATKWRQGLKIDTEKTPRVQNRHRNDAKV